MNQQTKDFFMENDIKFTVMKDGDGNDVYVINHETLTEQQLSKVEQFFKLHKDESVSK